LLNPDALTALAPEMLINCVPLGRTVPVFEDLVPRLPPHTILADITSIKGDLPRHYQRWGHPFLSFHPLFGPLFGPGDGHRTILVVSASDAAAKAWLWDHFPGPGHQIRELGFAEHDRAMVYTLGLPFLLSLLGLDLLPEAVFPGTGLTAFLGHGQRVLMESPDLLSAVLSQAVASELPQRMDDRLRDWRQRAIQGNLGAVLRRRLQEKLAKGVLRGISCPGAS
jgi:hypothetical protein